MNPLVLLAIGLGFVLLSGSEKSKSTTKTESEPEDSSSKQSSFGDKNTTLKGGIKPTSPKPTGGFSISTSKDSSFWNNSIEEKIKNAILKNAELYRQTYLIHEINSKIDLPDPDVILCHQIDTSDVVREIIKDSIFEVFNNLSESDLPPKQSSPVWIKTVWSNSYKIYAKEICS